MKIVKLLVNDKITALCHTRKHYFKSYKEQKRTTSFPGFTPTCPYGAWEREPGNEVARKNWKSSPFLFIRASICINCVQLHLCKVLSGNYLYFTQFGGRSHVHYLNFDKFRDTAPLSSMSSSISGPIYFFFSYNMLIHWWYFHSFGVWDFSLSNSCIEGYSEEVRPVGGCSGLFRGIPGCSGPVPSYTDTRNGCPLDAGRYKVGSIAFNIALQFTFFTCQG